MGQLFGGKHCKILVECGLVNAETQMLKLDVPQSLLIVFGTLIIQTRILNTHPHSTILQCNTQYMHAYELIPEDGNAAVLFLLNL